MQANGRTVPGTFTEQEIDACRKCRHISFLERILGIKISRIEYPKSQETIDISVDAKSVRLDIYVEDGKETVYNIEMQTTENRNLPKRTRYYQGMIDLNI